MIINPEDRKPEFVDRNSLVKAYMEMKHPKEIAVLVMIQKEYDLDEDENRVYRLAPSMLGRTGSISRELLLGNEYLLFRFDNEREADEFMDYLGSLDDLLPAELWINGSCISEL
jgi:hypothetical protein